ncbi:MAG: alcohol dehydrogenase catalytic domain-containing protein, partial [Pseudomonadota bacterium]
METCAIVLDQPMALSLRALPLTEPVAGDITVDIRWSGISTGTERLLWSGEMPPFPGLQYPLVPGYESVGEVVETHGATDFRPGDRVFVPGANCYG